MINSSIWFNKVKILTNGSIGRIKHAAQQSVRASHGN